jgi:hypothetical protein
MFSIRHTHHRIASLSVFAYFFFNFCFQISEQFFGPTVSVLLEAAAAAAAAGISQEFIVLTSQVLKQQEQFFGPTVSVLLEAAAAAAGISQEFIVLTSQVLKQQEQFFGPTVSVLLEAAAAAGISQEFIVLTSQVLKQQELKNIILSSCSFASAWVGVDGPFTTSFCCNGLIY